MKDFDWTKFTRRIAVKSTMKKMYDAWTKQDEIEKWFLSKAEYKDPKGKKIGRTSGVKENFSYDWNWHGYAITESGKYVSANGKDQLSFTFAGNCVVEIKLSKIKGHIMVELTQSNIPTDDVSRQQIRLGCDTGWSFFLVNLKSVYEGGLDLRNKQIDIKGVVNS